MALGNGELAHADQSVHLAGVLIAEEGRGLAQAHGQVAVGPGPVQKDLVLERARHGTQGEALLRLVLRVAQDEHAVEIMVPVAGDLIELPLCHQRCLRQQIAALLLLILDPALQQLDDPRALGQQDRQPLADDIDGGEILQLPAQLVVVPLQRLLLLLQVGVQLVLGREGDAVNALQHLPVGIAAPVRAAALRSA